MLMPWKGRRCWVVVEWWGKHQAAQGVLKESYKGIWEVRVTHGKEEFAVICDKCDIYRSQRRAQREARRRRTVERA